MAHWNISAGNALIPPRLLLLVTIALTLVIGVLGIWLGMLAVHLFVMLGVVWLPAVAWIIRARTRQVGLTRASFELILGIQLAHLGEHVIQMAQLFVLGWPPSDSRGLVSQLDVEKVHFLWNLVVLAALGWLLHRGIRSVWLTATCVWAVLHTAEHAYLIVNALRTGLESQPGVLGAKGLLATFGWQLGGLTSWSRPSVHFVWNVGEVTLLTLAFLAFAFPHWLPRFRLRRPKLMLHHPAIPLGFLIVAMIPSAAHAPHNTITALAPVELWADGFQDLRGIAVDAAGNVYVADRDAGTVTRIAPNRTKTRIVSNLERPIGLAFDLFGRLLIADERAGRVFRLELNGALTSIATGIDHPRWLAMSSSGTLYISARRSSHNDDHDSDRYHDWTEEYVIWVLSPSGTRTLFIGGFRDLEGLVVDSATLYAATEGRLTDSWTDGAIFQIPILANGQAGTPTRLGPARVFDEPLGLMRDRLGALSLTTDQLKLDSHRDAEQAIAKLHPDGHVTRFASNLDDPKGLVFDADGNLFVADGDSGRVLRFRAPPAPTLNAFPAFTNQSPLPVSGSTQPSARLDLFLNDAATPLTTTANAAGDFTVSVSLTLNAENHLELFATTNNGDGLTSPPTNASLTHDSLAPSVIFQAPPAGGFVRGTVTMQAQATDGGSGVAAIVLRDSQVLTATLTPSPPAPSITATAPWDTTTVADGTQNLAATATDRAGNSTTLTRSVIVDNTPPDTQITGGPSGDISETSATFSFTGTDNLTPAQNLQFAWRLDGAAFTAFSSATTATFGSLTEGAHTFEVKARDLAGNEDPTPASRNVTIRSGPAITNVDPPSDVIGSFVTINGSGFEPGATQVSFNGVQAILRSVTPTTITTTVPLSATTGPLTVTTSRGSASRAFTIITTQDFTIQAAPADAQTLQGASATYTIELISLGSSSFTGLATLAVEGLPSGLTADFGIPTLTGGQRGTLAVTASSTASLGLKTFTIRASAPGETGPITRTVAPTLNVLAGNRTALLGQVTFIDGTPIQGVNLFLGSQTTSSDAGGTFLFLDPPAGTQTLSVDANAAQVGLPIYAVDVTLTAGQATQLAPFRITPPPPPERFTLIDNATQDQVITDPRFPGASITLPAGVTITGWDGTLKTKIAIERVLPDALPVPHPPGVTRSLYQAFFGTPMGGLPSAPLPVTVPNDQDLAPGEQVEIWYYDAAPVPGAAAAWRLAGMGTVSDDGTTVVSNPGVGIQRFCGVCGLWCILKNVLGKPNVNPRGPRAGEPVDLGIGQQIVQKTDLVLPGRIPAVIHRTYNPFDAFDAIAGFELSLGPGWALSVDAVVLDEISRLRLIMPGDARFEFVPQPVDQFVNTTSPIFDGAVFTRVGATQVLRFKDGATWRFGPSANLGGISLLVEQADRNGNKIIITRNFRDKITRITEPSGRALFFTLNSSGNRVTQVRDPIGRTVRYSYNSSSRLETVTDPGGGVTRYTYDSAGRILTITDPLGNTFVDHDYDADGRVIRQTQADGGIWTFAYEGPVGAHTRVTVRDPRGNRTVHRMDNQGFTVETIDASGQPKRFQRDALGRVLAITDALGRVTRLEYDAVGNVTKITDPSGNARAFTYEPTFNRLTSLTDPLGNLATFEYDVKGNLIAATDPEQNKKPDPAQRLKTRISYNSPGQPLTTTDPLGNTTRFVYNGRGDLVTITDPLGNTMTREYDNASRLVRQIDPRQSTTTFSYTALNRLATITDALAGITRFEYDLNGNLLSVTDARNNVMSYTYDSMDQLATRTDALGAAQSFHYDRAGNLIQYTDRKGQIGTFSYDRLNRRIGASYADGTTATFIYDAGGRLVRASDTIGGEILHRYDALDRVIAQVTGLGTIVYQYDALGRRTRMDVPGQASALYGYDAAGRLTQAVQGGQVIDLQYDAAGRRTRLTLPNQVSTEYQYDAASRLTALIYRNALGLLGDLTYQYDKAGNRAGIGGSFARTLLPDPIDVGSYDAANRQLLFGDKQMTYDANGNVTSIAEPSGLSTFSWDSRNRPTALSGPSTNALFHYDPFGRRINKMLNGASTQYQYDFVHPVLELSAVNQSTQTLGGPSTDEYFLRTDATGSRGFISQALGSTLALTDSAGAVETEYRYDPFGKSSTTGAADSSPFQFTGRENDGSGLYYYRARYYHSQLHRFISEDPIGLASGDLNFYAYARNNPLRFTDPLGTYISLIHGAITYSAMRSMGYDPFTSAFVAGTNMGADFTPGSWAAENANWHAMATPGQSAEEARIGTGQFMDQMLEPTGNTLFDLVNLGRGLHASDDKFPSGHEGYQEWPGGWPSWEHIWGDIWPSLTDLINAYRAQRELLERYERLRRPPKKG